VFQIRGGIAILLYANGEKIVEAAVLLIPGVAIPNVGAQLHRHRP